MDQYLFGPNADIMLDFVRVDVTFEGMKRNIPRGCFWVEMHEEVYSLCLI